MNNFLAKTNYFHSNFWPECDLNNFPFNHSTEKNINTYHELNIPNELNNSYEEIEKYILTCTKNENIENSAENMNNIDLKIKSKINLIPFVTDLQLPKLYLEKDILQIVNKKMDIRDSIKNEIKKKLKSKFINDNTFLDIIRKEITEKVNTRNKKLNKEMKLKLKFGRKKKEDKSIRIHNKYTSDNIISKIKNILKRYLIKFVNNIVLSLYGKKTINKILTILKLPKHASLTLIKDIDYKSIANIKRKKENLNLLNLNIRQFLSFNISKRYRKITKNQNTDLSEYNQSIIEYLFKDVKNRDIFNFIFNELTVENFLDIFTHKRELNDFPQFNFIDISQAKIIEESLVRIEDYFEELSSEGDIYFICFLLLIFNYKRYYLIKQERKTKKLIEEKK